MSTDSLFAGKCVVIIAHENVPACTIAGRLAGKLLSAGATVTVVTPKDCTDMMKHVSPSSEDETRRLIISSDKVSDMGNSIVEEFRDRSPSKTKAPLHYLIHVPFYFWRIAQPTTELEVDISLSCERAWLSVSRPTCALTRAPPSAGAISCTTSC